MVKIGIFGGSFNPPHVGHLILAERAVEMLKLDKLLFVPAYIPPHKKKQHIIDSSHRINMLKLAITGRKNFEISDIEIKRGGTSYTYDTLIYLKEKYKNAQLFLIIGRDNYEDFSHWKNFESIFDLCHVVVLKRSIENAALTPNTVTQKAATPSGKNKPAKACFGKTFSAENHDSKFLFLDTPLLDISSSEIRGRFFTNKPVDYFVTEKVKRYILKHNLYKASL